MTDEELYLELRVVTGLRAREGWGRSAEANEVRRWCKRRKWAVQGELRRRGLPSVPYDGRWTGIGRGWMAEEGAK